MNLEELGSKHMAAEIEMEEELLPAAITDTGCERELNEDRYAVIESDAGVVWLICDGMGGVAGGELAAQLAIDSMRRAFESVQSDEPEKTLKAAIREANRVIVLRRQNQAFAQMGTTVVAVIFKQAEIVLASVGDSRAYLVRGSAIQQISHDHTLVQEMVDRGEIEAEDALSHPKAHVLTRAIGAEPGIEIDTKRYWVWDNTAGQSTDFVVLCSDGLYSHVADSEIAQIVSECSPQRACARLTELAKQRGGFDNITVAIVPLQGQLRKEPPQNYAPRTEKNKVKARSKNNQKNSNGKTMIWLVVSFFMLSIAVLVAVFGIVMLLRS